MPLDFVIAGTQKSGSTFLHECLMLHPKIHMDAQENTSFWKQDFEHQIQCSFLKHAGTMPNRLKGIKRPDYFYHRDIANRLHEHNPEMQIIVILRNPFVRTVASYFHLMSQNRIPLLGIEEGLPAILDNKLTCHSPQASSIINYSLYAEGLKAYYDVFPSDQIHTSLFGELKKNAQALLNRIFEFLNVHPIDISELKNTRPQSVVYSLERQRILRLRNVVRMKLNKHQIAEAWNKHLTDEETAFIYTINLFDQKIMAPKFKNKRPVLSDRLRERLATLFIPDIEAVESLLDISLSSWKTSDTQVRQASFSGVPRQLV